MTAHCFVDEKDESPDLEEVRNNLNSNSVISFHSEVPVEILSAMKAFIEKYPNWDQYRLIQAALAGFLVQNGMTSRDLTRLYISNMFGSRTQEYQN